MSGPSGEPRDARLVSLLSDGSGGCLLPDAVASRGRGAGHPGTPHHQFWGCRTESDDSP